LFDCESAPKRAAAVHNAFNLERHLISRATLRLFRAAAAQQWQNATGAACTALHRPKSGSSSFP
jgi:hypothetical protein